MDSTTRVEEDDSAVIKPKHIIIVGGGIIGLSCAIRAIQVYGSKIRITVISESFLSDTTSYKCGGLWEPYEVAGTRDEDILRWGKATLDYFLDLNFSDAAIKAGIQLTTSYTLFKHDEAFRTPFWHTIAPNFSILSSEALAKLRVPDIFSCGYRFDTVVVDQKYYLPHLMSTLKAKGVRFMQHKVTSFYSLCGPDVDCIINCTGLGARDLCGDANVFPIRGQVLRIRAPHLKVNWNFGPYYIIPNLDTVVLGGTGDHHEYDLTCSVANTERILDSIATLIPDIRNAPVEACWTGLRPARSNGCCLRSEWILEDGSTSEALDTAAFPTAQLLVHCYGHGGAGVTLSMGCAMDVVDNHLARIFV